MAAKKMKKMDKDDGSWMARAKIKSWVLIILGLLGLIQAVGYAPMPWYFGYVWSIIVLIIGIKKLWYLHSCK